MYQSEYMVLRTTYTSRCESTPSTKCNNIRVAGNGGDFSASITLFV